MYDDNDSTKKDFDNPETEEQEADATEEGGETDPAEEIHAGGYADLAYMEAMDPYNEYSEAV